MWQAEILVQHYLHQDPAEDLDSFMGQYAGALWMEERWANILTGAVNRAFAGK